MTEETRWATKPYQGYAGPGWSAIALIPADIAFEHTLARPDAKFSGEGVFSPRLMAVPAQAAAIQGNLDRIVWNGRLQRRSDDAGDNFSRALLAEIASTGRRTKGIFEAATNELLDTVTSSVLDEAKFLSGLAVDILDRNLFERACDCRWWATDSSLVDALTLRTPDACQHASSRMGVILNAYTVYFDLVLADLSGEIVANGRPDRFQSQRTNHATADWFQSALATSSGEEFGFHSAHPSSLVNGERVDQSVLRTGDTLTVGRVTFTITPA